MVRSRQFNRIYRTLSLTSALVLYAVAFSAMRFVALSSGFIHREVMQIVVTLAGMGAAAILFHISRNILLQAGTLVLQFLGAQFLSVLVGSHVWLSLLWVTPILLQFGLAMDLITLIPFSLVLIFSQFNDSDTVVAWGHQIEDAVTRDRLLGAGVALAILLAVAGLRYLFDRLVDHEDLVKNLKTNILKLTRANYDFQRYAADAEELTLKRERQRISREIHDTVGYTMTTLRMMLEASTDLIDESPLKLEVQLQKALDLMNRGHQDIRLSLRQLRERESDRPRGLKGLKSLIDLFSETTGVRVQTEWGNLPWRFPDNVEAALYRFIQEGMSNALSHGNATQVDLHFRMEGGDVVVVLSDDGVGADVLIEGLGLHGMRERIEECGGRFEARNTGEGFFLQARLPLEAGEDEENQTADR